MAQRPTVRISSSSRRPTVWCSRSQCQREAGLPSWSTSKTRCPMGSWCQMSHGSFHRAFYWLEPRGRSVHPRIEQLEPFATDCKLELHESGRVAARSRQTRDQAAADRIGDLDENNRHSAGYFLQGFHAAAANGDDHVRRKRHQFRGVFPVLARIAGTPTILDAHVDIIGPAQLLQPLLECRDLKARLLIVRDPGHQHADAPHPLALLRTRRERPGDRCAAKQRDEVAAFHELPSRVGARPSLLRYTTS